MANQRLINCDFFLKGAFDGVSSNKAKLLYFYFFINADDFGFVGNANKIIKDLKDESAEEGLVQYTFENAADDLVDKGFLFKFVDRHQNVIYLIRQWFIHNKYDIRNLKYLSTNYLSLKAQVEVVDGCYEKKENHIKKENKENNTNNVNNEKSKDINNGEDVWNELVESAKKLDQEKEVNDPLGIADDLDENEIEDYNKHFDKKGD